MSEFNKTKTINFEKVVLRRLDKLIAKNKQSEYVNRVVRGVVLNDAAYWAEKAKEYWMKFQEAKYMQEKAETYLTQKH